VVGLPLIAQVPYTGDVRCMASALSPADCFVLSSMLRQNVVSVVLDDEVANRVPFPAFGPCLDVDDCHGIFAFPAEGVTSRLIGRDSRLSASLVWIS
jgi:hypothetical protein